MNFLLQLQEKVECHSVGVFILNLRSNVVIPSPGQWMVNKTPKLACFGLRLSILCLLKTIYCEEPEAT